MTRLPDGWAITELDEINDAERPICYGILKPGPDLPGGVPYVKVKNIRDQQVNLSGLHRTSSAIHEKYHRSRLQPGDLLISIRGTYGRVAPVPAELADANITQDSARIAPVGVRADYLQQYLQGPIAQGYLAGVARGVAVKGVNIRDLRLTPVRVPPLSEQRRIVAAIEEAFSKLDAGEAALRTVRQLLKRLRNAVLTAALSGGLVEPDGSDSSVHKLLANLGVEAISPDGVPDLPAGWSWAPLGLVAYVTGGVTKDTKRQSDESFVERPYLRVANVQRGYLDLDTVTTIRVAPEKAARLELRPGDVLFTEGGDRDKLGRGWVWNGEIEGCIHQNHVFRARLRAGIEPSLVSMWGNTFGQKWFEGRGKQTTNLASISLATLKGLPVPLAPPEEQARILAEVDRQMSFIEACERAVDAGLERSAALRRSVLTAAFEGRLVPQDPTDEPATALLERIRAERAAAPKPKRRRAKASS